MELLTKELATGKNGLTAIMLRN